MNVNVRLSDLERIVVIEFPGIVVSTRIDLNKLRVNLIDTSFVEVSLSFSLPDRWAFHWERRHVDSTLYRHDSIPHERWKAISSYPWHFHNGNEDAVEYSSFGSDPVANIRTFFNFVKKHEISLEKNIHAWRSIWRSTVFLCIFYARMVVNFFPFGLNA
jgi:hypothetical protein